MTGVEIQRDRWGKPLIQPVGGGKPVAYDRASSFGEVLEDITPLVKWKLRMAVKGIATRPDLYLAASATPLEDRGSLNKIADQAIDAAGGSRASTIGSALHSFTETLDRGHDLPYVPPEYLADLDAYQVATASYDFIHIERFMTNDELRVAGTPDRLGYETNLAGDSEYLTVLDLKTGSDNRYLHKHAVQLAIYAHSDLYDPATGERTPVDVRQDYGLILHAPAGKGTCDVYEVDLERGWEGARLAADIRAWRRRKSQASLVVA